MKGMHIRTVALERVERWHAELSRILNLPQQNPIVSEMLHRSRMGDVQDIRAGNGGTVHATATRQSGRSKPLIGDMNFEARQTDDIMQRLEYQDEDAFRALMARLEGGPSWASDLAKRLHWRASRPHVELRGALMYIAGRLDS